MHSSKDFGGRSVLECPAIATWFVKAVQARRVSVYPLRPPHPYVMLPSYITSSQTMGFGVCCVHVALAMSSCCTSWPCRLTCEIQGRE